MKSFKQTIRKLILRFDGINIGKKLIFIYVIVIALPVIFFAGYLMKNFRNSSREEILRSMQQNIQSEKVKINSSVDIFERITETIISNKDFISFLSNRNEVSAENMIQFNKSIVSYIQKIQYVNPDIYTMRIFLNNPNISEIWPLVYSEDRIKDEEWRKELLNTNIKIYWNFSRKDLSHKTSLLTYNQEDRVSMYREVKDFTNHHLGIFEINMLSKRFFPLVYDETSDNSYFACIIRGENLYINENSSLFSSFKNEKKPFMDELKRNTKDEEGNFILKLGGTEAMVQYTFIKSLDAYIYEVKSLYQVNKSLERVRNIIILATIFVIAILSVITYSLTTIILKRISILIDSMRKVQEGEFDVEIPVRSNDELGELAHHFRKMLRKINELIDLIVKKQSAAKDAEIGALQSQINAHFIYNVLESIRMMAEIEEKYEISEALTSVGRLMRYGMKWRNQYTTLKDEIDNVKDYLTLINIRYDFQISLEINVDKLLLSHEMLKMTFQPIIENSVNYGIEPMDEDGTISITSFSDDNRLYIDIMDSGAGMEESELQEVRRNIELENTNANNHSKGSGIGLRNVNERIKLFYGSEYGIEVFSEKNKYTRVLIKLPYMSNERSDIIHEESINS